MRRFAWAPAAVTVALALVTVAFAFADHGTRVPAVDGGAVSAGAELVYGAMAIAYALLGGLLASRRPGNPIGWILSVSPFALGLSGAATGWYAHAEYAVPGAAGPPALLLWSANWIWVLGFMPLLTGLLLLFPDGRLPSRRWWPAGVLAVLTIAVLTFGFAFEPGPLDDFQRVENPVGIGGAAAELALQVGYPLFAVAAIACAAALVTRFRRSCGVERQQLKWVAAAAALLVLSWWASVAVNTIFGIDSEGFLMAPTLLALPAAATVAILRYRLYELGRIVNRALVYAALTATLAAAYFATVLLVGLAAGESDVAIAVSTLAVAALFRPARARIQGIVDRRFYRRRYDAARTLEAFGGRLREEVDLDTLAGDLRGVVDRTVQPAHVSLWLKGGS